eukprot:8201150-Karenia_brevis.AAC.1
MCVSPGILKPRSALRPCAPPSLMLCPLSHASSTFPTGGKPGINHADVGSWGCEVLSPTSFR